MNTYNLFCAAGEELVEHARLAEVSAWEDSVTGVNADSRKNTLLSAEKALLEHSKECSICNSAVYFHYLQ